MGADKLKEYIQDKEMEAIKRKILFSKSIDSVGALLLGIGLYGKFGSNVETFHNYLGNDTVVDGLLVSGGVLLALGTVLSFLFTRAKNKLARKPRV